jgi:hypothetical protein
MYSGKECILKKGVTMETPAAEPPDEISPAFQGRE